MVDDSSPTRLVALLRGVNVNGITVKSAALGACFSEQGFTAVRTVLASGNVVFDVAGDPAVVPVPLDVLKPRIEAALEASFGYDAWIVLLPQARLAGIAAAYPFRRTDDTDHPYVVFSSSDEVLAELLAASTALPQETEAIGAGDGVLYWRVPRGSSVETPVARLLARPKYRPHITTRNLRTVEKLTRA